MQCPRADTRTALEEMQRYAQQFNRGRGLTVVPFNDGRSDQARR